jgi:hypothetical protein
LQAISCEVEQSAEIDPDLNQPLEYVGGGFSIFILATTLNQDTGHNKTVNSKAPL